MWGFEVWLLNGCGPNLCFPKAFEQSTNFHGENPTTFAVKIRHRFSLGDMDYDNHTERGEQEYIYIHHVRCKHTEQESKCLHP